MELHPGISSVQIAAAKTHVPLDKSRVITMHITGSIEEKKKDCIMSNFIQNGMNDEILVPTLDFGFQNVNSVKSIFVPRCIATLLLG